MPTIEDFTNEMEKIAPPVLAEDWDNVGTLVNCGGNITKVLFALDITQEVVKEAKELGCELIVAHHPVIFKPMRSINSNDVVYTLVKNGISAICAHTNLDAADGGVNDVLAEIFGLVEVSSFADVGRIGKLPTPLSVQEVADMCIAKLGANVKLVDNGKKVAKIALLGGSGGGFLQDAIEAGADCYITGEAGHHNGIDADHAGIALVVAGHFSTEVPVLATVAKRLKLTFPEIETYISQQGKDPFSYCS